LSSICQESGLKTGLYTSPHLIDFRERIKLNGTQIEPQWITDFIQTHKTQFETLKPSFFEWTFVMACVFFETQEIDIAIIEVGLGGRLDATNVITPRLSVITSIGLDHKGVLGNSLTAIAKEKAGIIKTNVPVIVGNLQPECLEIVKEIALLKKAPIHQISTKHTADTDLKGPWQKHNAQLTKQAIHLVFQNEIDQVHVEKGLQYVVKNTQLLGRWQELQQAPLIVCDTAHNSAAWKVLLEQVKTVSAERIWMVIGFTQDKDVESIISQLNVDWKYILTQPENERALSVVELAEICKKYRLNYEIEPVLMKAYNLVTEQACAKDFILFAGSNYLIGDLLKII